MGKYRKLLQQYLNKIAGKPNYWAILFLEAFADFLDGELK